MKKLFVPFEKGSLKLKNHLVMAPMTGSRAIDNLPNELMATYYAQRSGAGLIVTEGTSPSPEGLGYARIPGIYSESQDVAGIAKDVDLVADTAGGKAQEKLFRVLKPGGKLLSIVTPPSPDLAERYNVKAYFVASNISPKSLQNGIDLIAAEKFKPIVSKVFKLEEAALAQDFLAAGGVNGKVVLYVK